MNVRKMVSGGLGLAAAVTISAVLGASGPCHTCMPYNVTSTVYDTLMGSPTQLQSDDYPSYDPAQGSATYQAGSGVINAIDSGDTDWELDLRSQQARGFYLTLVDTNGNPIAGVPAGRNFYNGRVVSRCFMPSGTVCNWLNIGPGAPVANASMFVQFTDGVNNYQLDMSSGYANTGRATITCNSSNGSMCVDWTVTPTTGVPYAAVANLYVVSDRAGKLQFIAACRLTFEMHVTYP